MKKKILTVVAVAMTMAMGAFAQTAPATATPAPAPAQVQTQPAPKPATPVVHQRQENQQDRIATGVKSGELTPKETQHLEKREAKIQHDKRKAKSDGKVTATERKKLTKEQNHASEAIKDQKHDTQTQH
jgi:curli biogenesis system outer membrane secretion channel CsgG